MSNTIRITYIRYEYDTNNLLIDSNNGIINNTYNEVSKDVSILATGLPWIPFTIGSITTGTFLRISSDQPINIRINGGTEIIPNIQDLIFNGGSITGLLIQNNSGYTATVTKELYGV